MQRVAVSKEHPAYLAYEDGRAFIPVGLNLAFQRFFGDDDEEGVLEAYAGQFRQLAQEGGNFARLWLGVPFFDIEPECCGSFDEQRCRRVQRVMKLAREQGIYIKLTLGHFRSLDALACAESFPGAASFVNQTQRPERGGSCRSMEEYLASAAGRESFLRKLDRLAETLRDADNLLMVELWNEMNAVATPPEVWRDWTERMLPELRRRFPGALITQSLGSFDHAAVAAPYEWLCSLPDNDLKQAHRYLDQKAQLPVCRGAMDLLCADAVTWLRGHGRNSPALLAEGGAVEPGHAGPSLLYPLDREGTLLHDILFAPFFAGSAGAGQCWHWDFYVEKNRLWRHFRRFQIAVERIDPVAEQMEPFRCDQHGLRIYGLRGNRHTLLWCRDAASDWKSELVENKPARRCSGLHITLPDVSVYQPDAIALQIWDEEWQTVAAAADGWRLPDFRRSLVLRLERKEEWGR